MDTGDTLGGRYRLVELVGVGGMGEVWRATQLALGREVAIKLLYRDRRAPGAQHTPVAVMEERFRREASLIAKVRHRNVVDVIDFGTTDDGTHFLVMPFLVGETLERRMGREPAPDVQELRLLFDGVLAGLGAIHDAGVIHRDLKPANIFLVRDADGVVPTLLDFGISREEERAPKSSQLTHEGAMMGTPHYMAPEQFESARTADRRADLYGVGAMLYEAFAGKVPYAGNDPFAVYRAILEGSAQPLGQLRPDLPLALLHVIDRALASDPDHRFPDARSMRSALAQALTLGDGASGRLSTRPDGNAPTALASSIPPAPRVPAFETPVPQNGSSHSGVAAAPKPKRRGVIWAGAALALVGAGFGGMAMWPDPPPPIVDTPELDAGTTAPIVAREQIVGVGANLETLALKWVRLPEETRARLRFAALGPDFVAVGRFDDAEAQAVSGAFNGTISDAPEGLSLIEPKLMHATARLNVRRSADPDAPSDFVLPHDGVVIVLFGTVDGAVSPSEEDRVWVVSSLERSGWAALSLLDDGARCVPDIRVFMSDVGDAMPRQRIRRTAVIAETELFAGSSFHGWLMAASDPSSSAVAIYRSLEDCQLDERMMSVELDGALDEFFLTEVGGELTLLVASWVPKRSSEPGERAWGAWDLNGRQVWEKTLVSSDRMDNSAAVSGTRDRAHRNHPERPLSYRRRGEPRVWLSWENGELREPEPEE